MYRSLRDRRIACRGRSSGAGSRGGINSAACVNRIAPVYSVYRWNGEVEQSEEQLLIVKTRRELFDALEKRVREIHSYSVPEIVALPIVHGSEAYLRWLADQTTGDAV